MEKWSKSDQKREISGILTGALCVWENNIYQVEEFVKIRPGFFFFFFFCVLMHPIQWTIANPVGTDRPTKHQKKTSCVSKIKT